MTRPPSALRWFALLICVLRLAGQPAANGQPGGPAPGGDWPRLQREWRQQEIAPELLSIAEAAVVQFPLAQHADMWTQLGPAYAILAKAAFNRQDYGRVRDVAATVEQHAAAHEFPDPAAPRNCVRAYYLEVVAAEDSPKRAAEIFDAYRAAEGTRLWRGRPAGSGRLYSPSLRSADGPLQVGCKRDQTLGLWPQFDGPLTKAGECAIILWARVMPHRRAG
jgi:hypothetical protein